MDERIGFYQSCGNRGVLDVFLCLGCGDVGGEWVGRLDQGLEMWGGVMSVCNVSPDSLCRWQVQVSVYCSCRIPAHLRCIQCSILLLLMDICFLTCVCLWQLLQIPTCLCEVVGPGFVSIASAFMRSSACHPAGPHNRLVPKTVIGHPFCCCCMPSSTILVC